MKTKLIGYFHPHSPLSRLYNLPDGGYYLTVVDEKTDRAQPDPIAIFTDLQTAKELSKVLDYPVDRYSIK